MAESELSHVPLELLDLQQLHPNLLILLLHGLLLAHDLRLAQPQLLGTLSRRALRPTAVLAAPLFEQLDLAEELGPLLLEARL